MAHVNNYEPDEIAPGERVQWRKSVAEFSAAEGDELNYYFRNESGTGFNVTGAPDGSAWKVTLEVPASVAAGRIDWEAWVTQNGEEYRVDSGYMTVKPSLRALAASDEFDGRSQAEKDLDAVRRALVPTTSASVQEYEITSGDTSRRLRHFNKTELLELETRLAQRVNAERRAAARRQGGRFFKSYVEG